jgi:isoquinoline 1-oxidoreductase subunit beta
MYIAPEKSRDAAPASGASRRELIVGAALVGGSLLVGCSPADIMGSGAPKTDFGAFGPFIKIDADGAVTVMNKHQEMGQGNHAGLSAIVAEEMDADWSTVKVQHSKANAKVYANSLMGVQGTGGSTAIANSWMQLRNAGATARAMFVQAAADSWKVPASEIKVKDGVVSHASGKSAHFGDLLAEAAKVKPPASVKLKDPKDFTLIGTDRVRRKDSLIKSTGQAKYTQDVYLPDMLTAVVAHPPRFGGKLASFDATEARKVPGVVDVFAIATGVAVVATGVHQARKGRDALKIQWDDSKAEARSSAEMMSDYHKIAKGELTPSEDKWAPFNAKGDAAGQFDGAEVLHATYDFPYLAHATMEPMNCVAQVDGSKCKLTYGAQGHSLDQMAAATVVLNLPGAIDIETLFAGGSFGRRSSWDSDYVVEAVQIAKHVGKFRPVKLVWTREDDMTAGHYRPMAHHSVAVRVGKDGYPAAWRHRIVIQSFAKASPMMASMMVKHNVDSTTVEGAADSPYLEATPVVDAQVFTPRSPVTTLWWRSVGATHIAPVMEHTIDQLAARAKIDPVEYRRELYRRAGEKGKRHLAVLNLAAEKAGWGSKLEDGWTRGVAVHESFGSVVANVCEAKVVNGEPRVRKVTVAVDCGIAIAPDQIRAQMEGGSCYGLSAALYGEISLDKGRPVQTNFDTYRVLRQNEAPLVETHIVPSANPPSGVGEPGTPVIMASLPNALFAATGQPVSRFPLVRS